jgi:hypothetical protein
MLSGQGNQLVGCGEVSLNSLAEIVKERVSGRTKQGRLELFVRHFDAIAATYQLGWPSVPSSEVCKCGQEFMGPATQKQCDKCLAKKAKRK